MRFARVPSCGKEDINAEAAGTATRITVVPCSFSSGAERSFQVLGCSLLLRPVTRPDGFVSNQGRTLATILSQDIDSSSFFVSPPLVGAIVFHCMFCSCFPVSKIVDLEVIL